MTILANYPNISQLSAKTNGPWDCVPTSIIDGMTYLTGNHFDIDVMVNTVYGTGYRGATSAARYVEYCAQHGVHLYPIDGPPPMLVADLHTLIQEGKPCLLTEPDVYAPAHPDWSHVLSVYAEAPGVLTARDPYSTHDVTHSDAQWASLLEFREIWVLEELHMQLDIAMPQVAALFEQLDATHWKDRATGRILQDAHLADYKANGVVSLERLGHMISPERYIGDDVIVNFEFGVRAWSKATGKVRSLALYDGGTGTDPAVAKLEAQLTAAQAQPAAPQEHAALLQMTEAGALALGKHLV